MISRGDVSPDGDGDEEVKMEPWRVPWWRSVGFWLGLWGLAFLVWVVVDSFANVSSVTAMKSVRSRGTPEGDIGWQVVLHLGRVTFTNESLGEAPPETLVFKRPVSFWRGKGGSPYNVGAWGMKSSVSKRRTAPRTLSFKTTECWFPFAFVMAGYGVVWLGSLVMWRGWMRRRWRVAQVVVAE